MDIETAERIIWYNDYIGCTYIRDNSVNDSDIEEARRILEAYEDPKSLIYRNELP